MYTNTVRMALCIFVWSKRLEIDSWPETFTHNLFIYELNNVTSNNV